MSRLLTTYRHIRQLSPSVFASSTPHIGGQEILIFCNVNELPKQRHLVINRGRAFAEHSIVYSPKQGKLGLFPPLLEGYICLNFEPKAAPPLRLIFTSSARGITVHSNNECYAYNEH
jgi:hypothetical protein